MSLGLIGKKLGMTRIYTGDGIAVSVTVLDVKGNQVVQVRSKDKDGYDAVQIGFDDQKPQRLTKQLQGHFTKHNAAPKRRLREFPIGAGESAPEDKNLPPTIFAVDQWVDVVGISKGKGFQGAMKRHNFHGQRQTHGSMMHRRTGAIGCRSTPGRVWPGQKMPGQLGNDRSTVQNLKIVQVREEEGLLLVSGSVPGAKGGYVMIRPAKKKAKPQSK